MGTTEMYEKGVEILKTRGWLKVGSHPPQGHNVAGSENPEPKA